MYGVALESPAVSFVPNDADDLPILSKSSSMPAMVDFSFFASPMKETFTLVSAMVLPSHLRDISGEFRRGEPDNVPRMDAVKVRQGGPLVDERRPYASGLVLSSEGVNAPTGTESMISARVIFG